MSTIAPFLAALALGFAGPALSAPASGNDSAPANAAATNESAPADSGRLKSVGQSAGRIASQPVKDVGVAKTTIPPALIAAAQNPYSLKGIRTCRDISAAFHAMTDVIGPDFKAGETKKENRAGKLAEAGGQTVVNSLIPFRGLVREVTGAAPAQRRLNRAIDAGYARRGFLRGVHQTRKCKTRLF
ncbi:MAG: hypothetical protein ABW128_14640 [Rhizorhabdus sp.]